MDDLKLLISKEQIAERVAAMGRHITAESEVEIILIGVLKGAAVFLSDLVREIGVRATFDFIGVTSYGSPRNDHKTWESSGEVRLTKDVDQSLRGKDVILVEDILDTGLTLTFLKRLLLGHEPKRLRVAVLLDKPSRRKMPVKADYTGFTIGDEFVVGYGMDYAESHRNLPDIRVMANVAAE